MDAPTPPRPSPLPMNEPQLAIWQDLVTELRTLSAQLEYVHLMLRLGARRIN